MKGDFDTAQRGKNFLTAQHKNVLNTPNGGNK